MAAGEIGGESVEISINNETIAIPHDYKIMDLLIHLKYTKSVAVFINGKQLLQSEYDNTNLSENDKIRIIKPLGGG